MQSTFYTTIAPDERHPVLVNIRTGSANKAASNYSTAISSDGIFRFEKFLAFLCDFFSNPCDESRQLGRIQSRHGYEIFEVPQHQLRRYCRQYVSHRVEMRYSFCEVASHGEGLQMHEMPDFDYRRGRQSFRLFDTFSSNVCVLYCLVVHNTLIFAGDCQANGQQKQHEREVHES